MKSRVQKWGNSLALRIPKAFAAEVGLKQNSTVEVSVQEGTLIVRATPIPKYSLADLLSQVTASNVHTEIDFGESVGGEGW